MGRDIVDYNGDAFDPGGAEHASGGTARMDMRAHAWMAANLRVMSNTADRMAGYLMRPSSDNAAQPHSHYVRDSRELWDRYRHLIAIYETMTTPLPASFRCRFTAWQDTFLQSDADDTPIDRAKHYKTHITGFFRELADISPRP
jgi:hypothetical protein